MRNNTMVTGVPPGITIPPPGLCLPATPDQIPMGTSGATQYVHLGFPSMNHMPPWTGQVMMGNQLMYHTGDMLAYPPSPLVSRQSSPSQSQSPSRSNSPMGRSGRTNTNPRTSSSQVTQPTSNTLTTSSTSSSNSQTSITGSGATNSNNNNSNNNSLPPLPVIGANRSLPSQQTPLLPSSRSVPLSITSSSSSFSRHNNIDSNTPSSTMISAQPKQVPPPPRLRPSNSGDSLRENTVGKEMPNFKGNLQNYSLNEVNNILLLIVCLK